MNIPFYQNCAGSRSRDGEHEILDLDDTNVALATDLCDGSRVELVLEIRSTGHDLRPCLTDDARTNGNVQGILDEVDAVREVPKASIVCQQPVKKQAIQMVVIINTFLKEVTYTMLEVFAAPDKIEFRTAVSSVLPSPFAPSAFTSMIWSTGTS